MNNKNLKRRAKNELQTKLNNNIDKAIELVEKILLEIGKAKFFGIEKLNKSLSL